MFANLIPLVALLFGIILGMGMCLFIVRWAFEYERKLIIEFMDRDEAKGAIQSILVPKEKKRGPTRKVRGRLPHSRLEEKREKGPSAQSG